MHVLSVFGVIGMTSSCDKVMNRVFASDEKGVKQMVGHVHCYAGL